MEPASRTPEGQSGACPVCGHAFYTDPAYPMGDAPCPNCGTLLWFDDEVKDIVIQQLAERGAFATKNDEGEIISIRFCGHFYDDFSVLRLAKITGVQTIDIRDTRITPAGAQRLCDAMPGTVILFEVDGSATYENQE